MTTPSTTDMDSSTMTSDSQPSTPNKDTNSQPVFKAHHPPPLRRLDFELPNGTTAKKKTEGKRKERHRTRTKRLDKINIMP